MQMNNEEGQNVTIDTRSDLEKDLKQYFGGAFGTKKQIKEYTNFGRERLTSFLRGIQSFGGNDAHGARWHAGDIADALWKLRTV